MRVLLTGAAGFVGSAVGAALVGAGHEVVRVDAMLPQAHAGATPPVGTFPVDVRDRAGLTALVDGVDVVCHQAALVGAGVSVADLPSYASVNDLGTATLLAVMAERGVDRLVLASSMVVYGEGRYQCPAHGPVAVGPRPVAALEQGDFDHRCPDCGRPLAWDLVEEDAPLDPRSAYAASKVAQEHYASAWARLVGGSVLALRYHNVYGPGMPRGTPYSGVAALFRSALERGRAPRVFEDGGQTRDFVHVADVARANLLAVESVVGRARGVLRSYNICSGSPVTIAQVAHLISTGAGSVVAPVVTGEFRPGDVRHVVASPARAAAELGFLASVPPDRGLPGFATDPLR